MLLELNESEIQEVLKNNSVGRIGCTDGENVYIVPVNYRYDENTVLCYSLEGLKIDMMRNHPSVCFEVEEIINTSNWKCVIINGTYGEITQKEELDLLRPHYTEYILRKRVSITSDKKEDKSNTGPDSKQVFFRIRFEKISGRSLNMEDS